MGRQSRQKREQKERKDAWHGPEKPAGESSRPACCTFCISRTPVQILLLMLAVGFTYWHTLEVPWYLDDFTDVADNPALHDLGNLAAIHQFAPARVVGYLTFALNYQLHQTELAGYHLTNILIHLLAGLTVYGLVGSLLRTPGLRETSGSGRHWLPLLTALLFLIHPLQTQAVTYVVQRLASLAALFYLASLFCFVKARLASGRAASLLWAVSTLLLALLAFFTKQNTITLPLALLLVELLFFRLPVRKLLLPAGAAAWLLLALLLFGQGALSPEALDRLTRETTEISRTAYFATQLQVLWTYLGLFFWPVGQQLDRAYPLAAGFADLPVLLALAGHLALLGLALGLARRLPLLAFGILFYYLAHLVESSVIPIRDVFFEHRTYLANFGAALAISLLFFHWRERLRPSLLLPAAACSLLLVLGLSTYQRNNLWREPVAFWQENLALSPASFRAHNNLGVLLKKENRLEEAVAHYRRALALRPDYDHAHNNLGNALLELGDLTNSARHLQRALELEPGLTEAHNNFGRLRQAQGRPGEAVDFFTRALALDPGYAEAENNLGLAYRDLGHPEQAAHHFQKALELDPGLVCAHNNLGLVRMEQGDLAEAHRCFTESRRLQPSAQASYNLGLAALHRRDYSGALAFFQEAVRLQPDLALAHLRLGIAAGTMGRREEAAEAFRTAARLDPNLTEARTNLAIVLNNPAQPE